MKKQDKNALTKEEMNTILDKLYKLYPNAECELNYNTPFQLLVATVLSAQTTDKKVNEVTKQLFAEYPTVYSFSKLPILELEDRIKKIGLYRTKSKNILKTVKILIEEYNAQVPSEFNDLVSLHGVGRKTANVVLSNAFNVPAIAVDTHVFRVSNRIGLATSDTVNDTEKQLMRNIPKSKWSDAHHWIIYHGRRVCKARKPLCEECTLIDECVYYRKMAEK